MTTNWLKLKQPHELLKHILDNPELPAIIRSLDAGVLTKLIRHVGLEDSAEIVSLATVAQLERVFDEDLWYSNAPGREEVFDAGRFGMWLEIMLESGSALTARRVMELDEDLLTLALCRLVLVVDFDELALRMSHSLRLPEDDIADKVLESTLNQEFDSFLVIARHPSHWQAVRTILVELNELDYAMLNRLLERCCRISCEYIEDNGGLFDVLSADAMLEADMAADREARRESHGFVSASAAAGFLHLTRTTTLKKIVAAGALNPAVRAYYRATGAATDPAPATRRDTVPPKKITPGHTDSNVVHFLQTLQAAEVLPASDLLKLSYTGESEDQHPPLMHAMRLINRTDPALYAQRLMEIANLSNILISGCGFQGRVFRPVEAAEAALSTCNLGGAYLLGDEAAPSVDAMAALLREQPLVKLFQVGWKVLHDQVVRYSAKAVVTFCDRLKGGLTDPQHVRDISRLADILRLRIEAGRPWAVDDQLDQLLAFWDGETITALKALLQEYPTIPEVIARQGQSGQSPYIWSNDHIRTIRRCLKTILLPGWKGGRPLYFYI
jgi:hypothetical protein